MLHKISISLSSQTHNYIMFFNIFKNKCQIDNNDNDNDPYMIFRHRPIKVLDTLYLLHVKCNKNVFFTSVLDEIIRGKYGCFRDDIVIQVLIRAMILSRDNKNKQNDYYIKMKRIINKNNGNIENITAQTKNVINAELGFHYINYYHNYAKADKVYDSVLNTVASAFEITNAKNNNDIRCIIYNNMDLSHQTLQHVYQIDDIISVDMDDMYTVLKAGFNTKRNMSVNRRWYQWKANENYTELFELVIDLYSQLEFPLCTNVNITDAVNECIFTFTNDTPVMNVTPRMIILLEKRLKITFDKNTMKFKW